MRSLYLGRMPEPRKATLRLRPQKELVHVAGLRPDWQRVAVADAGADNSTVPLASIPKAYRQIDYRHACQRLGVAAEDIFPLDSAARERWSRIFRHMLCYDPGGAGKVVRSLRDCHNPGGRLDAGIESELNYVRDHRNRMHYARHQSMSLPTENGLMQSADRTLIGARMKRSSQR